MPLNLLICVLGYKLRQQISKGLQQRSEAIRKAIHRYNVQAAALTPPRPPVSWKDLTQHTILGKFDLLRYARNDIRDREWAKPAVREATAKFFKLCRAKEELIQLNIEICRLRTAIHDEEAEISAAIMRLSKSDQLLACELRRLHCSRFAVNALHIDRLNQIQKLYGFVQQAGVRRMEAVQDNVPREAVQDNIPRKAVQDNVPREAVQDNVPSKDFMHNDAEESIHNPGNVDDNTPRQDSRVEEPDCACLTFFLVI